MNLDKKLAKYAKQLDNPKYYIKILKIIYKADDKHYKFKDFSDADIIHIFDVIDGYFGVNYTPEMHKRVVKYCNSVWFLVSDKHYTIEETPCLLIALFDYFYASFLVLYSKFTRLINPLHFSVCENVDSHLYIFRGALKASEYIGCEIDDLEENHIIE